MKKRLSKWMLVLLAVCVVLGSAPTVTDARGPGHKKHEDRGRGHGQHKHWKLKDMDQHWAEQTVEKMSLLGIIKGYEDGTFLPNKKVTHAEAVVMTIRLLDMEDEVDDVDADDLPFRDANSIPGWARGHVALALEEGIIEESHVFQANKPATRLYVVMLLVNAIGAEFDQDWEEAKTYFNDVDNLDEKERAYLAYATLMEIVSGYGDGSFRPNSHVTRAEMATLISRVMEKVEADKEIDFENEIEGIIKEIDLDDLEISVRHEVYADDDKKMVTFTYELDAEADIFIDGEEAEAEDLREGMEIEFIVEDDVIVYVEAESTDEEEERVFSGVVTDISGDKIWIDVKKVGVLPFSLADDAEIVRDGDDIALEDIASGSKITFVLNEKGNITRITVDEWEDAIDEETEEYLRYFEDVEKFLVKLEADEFELEYKVEIDSDHDYEAKVLLEDEEAETKQEGKQALEEITGMLDDLGIDEVDFGKVNGEEIVAYLMDEYDVETYEEAKVEFEKDDQTFKWENQDGQREDDEDEEGDEENEELSEAFEDVEEFLVKIEGDDFKLEYKVEVKEDEIEAKVLLENENSKTELKGSAALQTVEQMLEALDIEQVNAGIDGEAVVQHLLETHDLDADAYNEAKVEVKKDGSDYKWENR